MVTEQEILSNFLLERTSFEKALSFGQFRKLFPKGTQERTIQQIYSYLLTGQRNRLKAVSKAIDDFTESSIVELESREADSFLGGATIEDINSKLDLLSQILSDEVIAKESKYKEQLSELKYKIQELRNLEISDYGSELAIYTEELSNSLVSINQVLGPERIMR